MVTALAGAALMLVHLALGRSEERAAVSFVLIWTAFMPAATLTQSRFNYYLVVPVAVLNAFFVGQVLHYVDSTDARSSLRNLRAYQVFKVLAVVFLITAPLAAGGGRERDRRRQLRRPEFRTQFVCDQLGWQPRVDGEQHAG